MREIPLTRGLMALVDDEDYELLSPHKWHASQANAKFYAARNSGRPPNRMPLRMHRIICPVPPGMQVDHINGNTLDNRRANLRPATHAQNVHNRGITRFNMSGYKGVTWNHRRWMARIEVDGLPKYLGTFDSPAEAHAAYRVAAEKLHGEFARFA